MLLAIGFIHHLLSVEQTLLITLLTKMLIKQLIHDMRGITLLPNTLRIHIAYEKNGPCDTQIDLTINIASSPLRTVEAIVENHS